MATYEYMIGLTYGTLVNVEVMAPALANQCVPPQGLAIESFSVYRTAASGLEVGDGFPRTAWFFPVIHQTQLTAFYTLLGTAQSVSVYIRTRDAKRTYAYYTAIMHRPKPTEMTPAYSSHWHNVTIPFTMLEVYTP